MIAHDYIAHDFPLLLKKIKRLGAPAQLRCCYEAGPTGYRFCRRLREAGIDYQVAVPSLVPTKASDCVKTDHRDAKMLAHFLRSGDLTPVYVPSEADEALRDLERAREDAKRAERAARHQLSKFLLGHGRHWSKSSWTQAHSPPAGIGFGERTRRHAGGMTQGRSRANMARACPSSRQPSHREILSCPPSSLPQRPRTRS